MISSVNIAQTDINIKFVLDLILYDKFTMPNISATTVVKWVILYGGKS